MVMRTQGMTERFRMERAELGLVVPRGGEGEAVWFSDEVLLGEEERGRKEEVQVVEDDQDQEEARTAMDGEGRDIEIRIQEGDVETGEHEAEAREITSGDEEVRGREIKDGESKMKTPFWKFWAR